MAEILLAVELPSDGVRSKLKGGFRNFLRGDLMKRIHTTAAILLTVITGATIVRAAEPQNITQDELVRRTQAMLDAVVPGDKKPWEENFADDAMYFDEKGRSMDKKALVADITPLPQGYSGTIKIVNAKSRILGTTAILSFDSDETETVFGQNMTARYHETDTWMYRNGKWQIVAGQVLRYYEDPALGTIDAAKVGDFVGNYQLVPGRQEKVVKDGNALFLEREGRPRQELKSEACDIFFRPGVEGRIVFGRGADGKVDRLIDRRNNEDVVWKRVP
jgi:hypothetical protein